MKSQNEYIYFLIAYLSTNASIAEILTNLRL